METFASYYGSVLLDPSRTKELGPLIRFLRQTAQSLEEVDSLQVVDFEGHSGKFRIDMEGVLDSQTHKKVVAVLQALGRFAMGVGSFTIEQDQHSYTIWIGAEHDVRRTKVGIYLQAAVQLLKKAVELAESSQDLQRIIEDLEALEEARYGKDFGLLPPL